MANFGKVDVDVLDTIGDLTVDVRTRNLWRLKLGLWLLYLAARMLRTNVRIGPVDAIEAD